LKSVLQSIQPDRLDSSTFFETAVFSFLIGNADMHLKNFSLLTSKENDFPIITF